MWARKASGDRARVSASLGRRARVSRGTARSVRRSEPSPPGLPAVRRRFSAVEAVPATRSRPRGRGEHDECSRGVRVDPFTLCGLALEEGCGGADMRRRASGNRGAGVALRACVGVACPRCQGWGPGGGDRVWLRLEWIGYDFR